MHGEEREVTASNLLRWNSSGEKETSNQVNSVFAWCAIYLSVTARAVEDGVFLRRGHGISPCRVRPHVQADLLAASNKPKVQFLRKETISSLYNLSSQPFIPGKSDSCRSHRRMEYHSVFQY
jgi:hypothetical protein